MTTILSYTGLSYYKDNTNQEFINIIFIATTSNNSYEYGFNNDSTNLPLTWTTVPNISNTIPSNTPIRAKLPYITGSGNLVWIRVSGNTDSLTYIWQIFSINSYTNILSTTNTSMSNFTNIQLITTSSGKYKQTGSFTPIQTNIYYTSQPLTVNIPSTSSYSQSNPLYIMSQKNIILQAINDTSNIAGNDIIMIGSSNENEPGILIQNNATLSKAGADSTLTLNGIGTSLAKVGIRITGQNTYSGAITLDGEAIGGPGILIQDSAALGNLGPGILALTGTATTNGVGLSITGVTTYSGAITLDGETRGPNGTGILIEAGAELTKTGTEILALTGKDTTNGIGLSITGVTTYSGAITLDGEAPNGTGIFIDSADLAKTDTGILALTGISTGGFGLIINGVTRYSGAITLDGEAQNGTGIYIQGIAELSKTGTGILALTGISTGGFGLIINGVTRYSGAITLDGETRGPNGTGIFIVSGADLAKTGTEILALTGKATASGIGLNITGVTTYSGAITLTGESTSGKGISIAAATLTKTGTGILALTGISTGGIGLFITDLTSYSGQITLDGEADSGTGIFIQGATLTKTGTEILALTGKATTNGFGINITGVTTYSGAITLDGEAQNGTGISIQGATLTKTGTEILALIGKATAGGNGLTISGITSYFGEITLNGEATSGSGILIENGTTLTNTYARILPLSGKATANGTGLIITGVNTYSGLIILYGESTGTSGKGISIAAAELIKIDTGILPLIGTATANGTGLIITGVNTYSGPITLTGEATIGNGISIQGATLTKTGTGNLPLTGKATANGIGLFINGITSYSGQITLDGEADSGTGIFIQGATLTKTGTEILALTGKATANGITINGVTKYSDNITLTGETISGIGIFIQSAELINIGTGNLPLTGKGNSSGGTGLFINGVTRYSGDITLNGEATSGNGIFIISATLTQIEACTLILNAASIRFLNSCTINIYFNSVDNTYGVLNILTPNSIISGTFTFGIAPTSNLEAAGNFPDTMINIPASKITNATGTNNVITGRFGTGSDSISWTVTKSNNNSNNWSLTTPGACLLEGTLIHTPSGYLPIENLNKGDQVITADNRIVKIISTYHNITYSDSELFVIKQNSVDINIPSQDLYLSRGHLVKIHNKYMRPGDFKSRLIKKCVGMRELSFYHLELENFKTDFLRANNLEVESYRNVKIHPIK